MGYSFSASKRREFSRNTPEVRAMIMVAERYGFNQGSSDQKDTYLDLFKRYSSGAPGGLRSDWQSVGTRLAEETVGSDYRTAVNAAWAAAALLSNKEVLEIARAIGSQSVNIGATRFTDEFSGVTKSKVLGKRLWNWRIPAAIAAVFLIAHAEDMSMNGEGHQG
jgi:hypothetical protein